MEQYAFLIGSVAIVVAVIVAGMMISKSRKKEAEERVRAAKIANKRAVAMKSVRNLPWGNQFSIDGGVIDKEHQTLFGLVKEFNDCIPTLESPGQMLPILANLKKLTQTHFQREEKLQQLTDYPFCDEHKKEHQDTVEKLNDFINKVMKANEENIFDVFVEISTFLQKWLSKHVIESDLPMRPYVDRKREQAKKAGEEVA